MPGKRRKWKTLELPAVPEEVEERFVKGSMTAEAVNAASLAFEVLMKFTQTLPMRSSCVGESHDRK
jgi:hypothetical protein